MQAVRQDVASTGSKALPKDIDGGKAGDKVLITTNNWKAKLDLTRARPWFQYDGTVFEPAAERRDLRARAIAHIQERNPEIFSQARGSYDGSANFCEQPHVLSVASRPSNLIEILLQDSIMDLGPVRRYPNVFESKTPINVTLTKVAHIQLRDLGPFVMRKQNISAQGLNTLTLMSILLKMGPMMNQHVANNRCVYNRGDARNLGRGLEVWRGFYQSPRPGWGALWINVDLTAGVMYKAGALAGFLLDYLNEHNLNALYNLTPERRREINRYIKGIDITAKHLPHQRPQQFKRLDEKTPSTFVFEHGGADISVAEYYQQKYRQTVNPNLPLVDIGRKRMWPLELCEIRPGQLLKKTVKLSPEQVNTVLGFATQRPEKRLELLIKGINTVLNYGSDYIVNSGIDVITQGEEAPAPNPNARILRAPHLHYGNNQKMQPVDGKWNMLKKRYSSGARMHIWLVLVLDPRWYNNNAARALAFAGEMLEVCGAVGMDVRPCSLVELIKTDNLQQDMGAACGRAIRNARAKNIQSNKIDLIICILPANSQPIKTEIKRFGDILQGIATQVVIGSKLKDAGSNPSNQYCNNLALKINAKLGGTNWMSAHDAVPFFVRRATMIIGIDTSHGDPSSGSQPSVAAFVSSVDHPCSVYVGQCGLQSSRQEVVDPQVLTGMVVNALNKYKAYHVNVLKNQGVGPPQQILVYRDGVAESQFQEVIDVEYQAIKAGFAKCNIRDDHYRVTFIAVGKKHHLRMFPKSKESNDGKTGNCRSGTVVDTQASPISTHYLNSHCVVNPWWNDFYLLSHAGLLGTSRPAHYSVLVNDIAMSLDDLQAVSFALCHLFTRSTRTVSIPAPIYHADLIAARLRYHILNDELFNPDHTHNGNPTLTSEQLLLPWQQAWKPIHATLQERMYWM
ncbi:hypothetical protein FRB98_007375 [Tulasnella sp. 332]|nr:hypothetical protein FRB98_007375 [Tulasnella sp. 332]